MACGECGDPRQLCRCSIEAGDPSVTITGTGEPGDPYVISAPGAGAGTRTWDRASVYAGSDGHYPSPPPEYAKFDWFGPTDPTADGQSPRQYDGWYSTANDAPISVRYTDFVSPEVFLRAVQRVN